MEILINIINKGCDNCNDKLQQHQMRMEGHCLIITLKCKNGHTKQWSGSAKLKDNTYEINRRMVCSFETTGVDIERYTELCEVIEFGMVERDDAKKWLEKIMLIIDKMVKTSMATAITEENNNTQQLKEQQIQRQQELQQRFQQHLLSLSQNTTVSTTLPEVPALFISSASVTSTASVAAVASVVSATPVASVAPITPLTSVAPLVTQAAPTLPINSSTVSTTITAQVALLLQYNVPLQDSIIEDFLNININISTRNKRYNKQALQSILRQIQQKTTGNKPLLIDRIQTYLRLKLQSNNDPIASIPPPPPPPIEDHDSVGTVLLHDAQHSRPQKYPK